MKDTLTLSLFVRILPVYSQLDLLVSSPLFLSSRRDSSYNAGIVVSLAVKNCLYDIDWARYLPFDSIPFSVGRVVADRRAAKVSLI